MPRFVRLFAPFAALYAVVTLGMPAQGWARGRDADGSRMLAREVPRGATVEDSLAPPRDAVDWWSTRVNDAGWITVEVRGEGLEVQLTDATGRTVGRQRSAEGVVLLKVEVKAGIYFLAVTSAKPVSYRLTIR